MKAILIIWSLSTPAAPSVDDFNNMVDCNRAKDAVLSVVSNIHFGIECKLLQGVTGGNQKRGEK